MIEYRPGLIAICVQADEAVWPELMPGALLPTPTQSAAAISVKPLNVLGALVVKSSKDVTSAKTTGVSIKASLKNVKVIILS